MEVKGLLELGPFRVDVARRAVLREGQPVPLPGKAFDVLLALLQSPGETVFKDDLLKAVWPDTFVEEGNLTQTIFVLRKALGDFNGQSLIVTVPRQGYRLAAAVTPAGPLQPDNAPTPVSGPRAYVPSRAAMPWVVSAALALVAAAMTWFALRPTLPAKTALLRLNVDVEPGDLHPRSTVALSPDGSRMAFVIGHRWEVRSGSPRAHWIVRRSRCCPEPPGPPIHSSPQTANGSDTGQAERWRSSSREARPPRSATPAGLRRKTGG